MEEWEDGDWMVSLFCRGVQFYPCEPTKTRRKKGRAANSYVDSYQQHLALKRETRAPADGGLDSQGPVRLA